MRIIVGALEKFDASSQQRVLRYVQEKLGLGVSPKSSDLQPKKEPDLGAPLAAPGAGSDIKSFIEKKNPNSDTQFAAAVAYYYQFEVPPGMQKTSITSDDLQDACRKVGRDRFPKPAQTLVNAHNLGLLDKAGERGSYALSTVGENLVAVALPSDGTVVRRVKRSARKKANGRAKKGR